VITQEQVKSVLNYDPISGIFTRKVATTNSIKVGDIAGCFDNSNGYLRICVNEKNYFAHRLAWLYMTGELTQNVVDHINGNRIDNRFSNLRHIPWRKNCQNKIKNRKGKSPGVTFRKDCPDRPWLAGIKIDNKSYTLGFFKTEQEASEAYLAACKNPDYVKAQMV
jgi:hypothetical protein